MLLFTQSNINNIYNIWQYNVYVYIIIFSFSLNSRHRSADNIKLYNII